MSDDEMPSLIENEMPPLIENESESEEEEVIQQDESQNQDGGEREERIDCFLHPRVIHELKNYFPTSKLIAEYLGELAQNISVKQVTVNMYVDHNHSRTGQFYFVAESKDAPGIRELFDSFVLLTSLPKPGSLI